MYSGLSLEAWCFIILLTSTGVPFMALDIHIHLSSYAQSQTISCFMSSNFEVVYLTQIGSVGV